MVSIYSKISSTLSDGTYSNLLISTPIASKNSLLTALSVSIITATPLACCVDASACAANKLFPDCSNPFNSIILPIGNPPLGLLDIAISSIALPVEIHPNTFEGVPSSDKKWATLPSFDFLFNVSANN